MRWQILRFKHTEYDKFYDYIVNKYSLRLNQTTEHFSTIRYTYNTTFCSIIEHENISRWVYNDKLTTVQVVTGIIQFQNWRNLRRIQRGDGEIFPLKMKKKQEGEKMVFLTKFLGMWANKWGETCCSGFTPVLIGR